MNDRREPWLICGGLLLLLWLALSWALGPFTVPRPTSVWLTLTAQPSKHVHNICVSAGLALGGLAVASAAAGILIVVIGALPRARHYLYPYFVMIKSTPALAIAPVLMCLVGIGAWCKVLVAASIAFFPLVVGGVDALSWMPDNMTNMAKCYGATRLRFLRNVAWGYILSGFLTGMKTAAPLSVVGAMVGEFVSAGSPTGLGMFILSSNVSLVRADVFAGGILASLLGLTFFGVASLLKNAAERRLHLGR